MSIAGTHRARAKEWGLGHAGNGNEQVAVLFELTQGEHAGKSITWFGYFSDAAVDRTLDSLRYCGWEGDNFAELAGLDANEVELVIEADTYEGKTRDRVRWVNRPSRLALREQMNPSATVTFAARMRAKALAHRQTFNGGARAATPNRTPPGGSAHSAQPGGGGRSAPQGEPFPGDDDIPF